jgi:predicted HTH domain antitoxin
VLDALKVPQDEAPARLRRELALRLYEKGLLSFGKARELSGLPRWEFHELLGEQGILRSYGSDNLEADLAALQTLR